jgi:predicted aconitase
MSPELDVENFDYADYGAVAYWTGKILVNGVPVLPVYEGLTPLLTIDHLKNMSLSHGWNSGVNMFHVVGVTPEAPTVDAAFGGKKPVAKIVLGKKEVKKAYEELTSATEEKVDMVRLGCPHCGIQELAYIAKLLNGRKVHRNTQLVIATGRVIGELAKRMGIIDEIENAGGVVLLDTCCNRNHQVGLDSFVLATSDAAPCFLCGFRSKGAVKVWYGKTADCINAAVKGKWEAS